MINLRNVAKERLEAGEIAIGIGLRQARTVDIGKAMRTAGYDFLFIDMEHNSMSIDTAAQISVAAQDAGITPLVRVPGPEPFHASRALDAGAQGIVVPHVDTPEIAARMVAQCRYPPHATARSPARCRSSTSEAIRSRSGPRRSIGRRCSC